MEEIFNSTISIISNILNYLIVVTESLLSNPIFIIIISLAILGIIFKIIERIISNIKYNNYIKKDMRREAIRQAHYYKTGEKPNSIAELDINITTKVKCVEEKIDKNGKIELHGCTVENSKVKYGYINNKIVKE